MSEQRHGDSGADLNLVSLTKSFGAFTAVDDLSLTVPQGSFRPYPAR